MGMSTPSLLYVFFAEKCFQIGLTYLSPEINAENGGSCTFFK